MVGDPGVQGFLVLGQDFYIDVSRNVLYLMMRADALHVIDTNITQYNLFKL